MPAPCRNTTGARPGSKAAPPVPAKTVRPATSSCNALLLLGGLERLVEIGEQVLRLLESDREGPHVLAHARGGARRGAHLLLGGPRRMNPQRLGVAHVGEMG